MRSRKVNAIYSRRNGKLIRADHADIGQSIAIEVCDSDSADAGAVGLRTCLGSIGERAGAISEEDHRFAKEHRAAVRATAFGCAVGYDNVVGAARFKFADGK